LLFLKKRPPLFLTDRNQWFDQSNDPDARPIGPQGSRQESTPAILTKKIRPTPKGHLLASLIPIEAI